MKILFVSMQYGEGYVQGTERYLATLGACLRGRGHEVSYLAGDPLGLYGPEKFGTERARGRGGEGANEKCGVDSKSQIADSKSGIQNLKPIYSYPTRGWMTIMGISPSRVAKWLKANRPDLVHVANPAHIGVGVTGACYELGIPFVVTTMDFWWVCPKATLLRADGSICDGTPEWEECTRCVTATHMRSSVRKLSHLPGSFLLHAYALAAMARGRSPIDVLRWTERREALSAGLNTADFVIFPSAATANMIRPHLNHGRHGLIPYGLPDEWFAEPRSQATAERAPEAMTVGYAGAMLAHKGPHLLLEAIRKLGWTRTRVRLAGPIDDSAYARALRELAAGLNVEFMGSLSPEAMRIFLRSLDVLAMTSTWPENLPFIVLEAQAAGVPVVGSRLAGVADQIGSESLLFEPGCVDGLASALDFARKHAQSIPAARVQTVDEMTDQTEAVYKKVSG